ncbi:MAG: PP2C family protein-serine/threonine phosphatase [Anaerolineales bacterium]
MRDHFLYPLFRKLRPNEAELNDPRALQPFIEFFSIVYLTPFSLIGIIWLFVASDFSQIGFEPRGFVILFISLLIIQSKPASVPLKLGDRGMINLTVSLGSILVWVGMFIWGPVALVFDLLVSSILRIQEAWRRSRYTENTGWMLVPYFLQDITNTTLTNLIGITVYQAIGGKIPLDSVLFIDWIPAFIAILVAAFFTVVVMLPIIIQINRFTNVANDWTSLGAFVLAVVRVLLVTTPFAIPFTLLYTQAHPDVNLFATIGLVLVNLLLYYLGQTNQRSNQRTREMTQLEALGEAIIQAPPDGSTLKELLVQSVERMFQDPNDMLEIRIFEGIDTPGFEGGAESIHLVHPAHRSPTPDSLWNDLQKTADPYMLIKDVIPDGSKAVYGDAIIDKITSAAPTENGEEPTCIGGIYLLRHKSVAKSVDALPAVQALASQVASALYRAQVHAETLNAHRMAQELAFAGGIQASFLPERVPTVDGWSIAASLTPARQTSGDFYDFIPLGEDSLGLVVADVADKGTGAALYMALSRTLIRTYAMQYPDNPVEVMQLTNERMLADTRANQFVTVFYAVLNLVTGKMIYCSAGHNPAFVFRATNPGSPESYIRTGAPLGIFGDLQWDVGTLQLNPGDILLLYTDGVNEAQNIDEQFYGYERLLEVTGSKLNQNAVELHNAIIDNVKRFVGNAPQFDDITVMVVKRDGI